MTAPRITPAQAQEVERLRGLGRTNSQIEKIVGIARGVLSGRFTIGEDPRPIFERNVNAGSGWRYDTKPEDRS